MKRKKKKKKYFHFNIFFFSFAGNMSGGVLRCGVLGEIMERGLQIEVYGLLRQAPLHTETDLYHR